MKNQINVHKGLVPEKTKPEIKRPPLYKVLLLNDDYTPMDFVVAILKEIFSMDDEKATLIMWQVHTQGKGLCGIYSHDIAETKVSQVNDFARQNDHPLLCQMEKT